MQKVLIKKINVMKLELNFFEKCVILVRQIIEKIIEKSKERITILLTRSYNEDSIFIFCSKFILEYIFMYLFYIFLKISEFIYIFYLMFKERVIRVISQIFYSFISLFNIFLSKIFFYLGLNIAKTPNLTLYNPLKSSMISVILRFMGTLLIVLLFICVCVAYFILIVDSSAAILIFFGFSGKFLSSGFLLNHIISAIEHLFGWDSKDV